MVSYSKDDPQSIRTMFNSIARQYDKTNAILSFSMHKRWNRALINKTAVAAKPQIILDICCGTGAIAFEYLKDIQYPVKAFMLDFSEKMLECAQAQAKIKNLHRHDINYLQANAQEIPLLENSIDCATMAYGIRNVPNPERCLKEVYRVLRPRGIFGILELTQPTNPIMRSGHSLYLKTVLPIIGKLATSNKEAYLYLRNSISSFISPSTLVELMQTTGFVNVKTTPLFGGIATIITGVK
jgi:demethylmenaquinone methyltransferase/2-methoxy-6-polyprenyl-1,4-benzoquinol methylase